MEYFLSSGFAQNIGFEFHFNGQFPFEKCFQTNVELSINSS